MSIGAIARASNAVNQAAPPPSHLTCSVCRAVYRSGFPRCPKDGGVLQPFEVDPLEGTTFVDRYQIESFVGEGAMGRVYRARHSRMSGRVFAVKVMFGDLAADHKMRSRFAHEAEASSRLNHPNLVSVVDFGETPDGLLYLVMDFIEGRNLADLLDEGALPERRVVQLLSGIAQGLEHAHEQGLIHRDLKTENVVVVNDGGRELPRVVDFGIAKLAEAESGEVQLTAQGCVVGTPAYMSPEQACGEPIDIRSDFFSLGLITYELLAGKKPFDGSPMEVARQNISSDPPPIGHRLPQAIVSPELEALVFKLLAKHRDDRPKNASEIVERLEEIYGSDVVFAGSAPVRKSQSKSDLAPGDDMLAALSASASRFKTSASETIASLERAALGGNKRGVLIGLVALIVLLSGVGIMRLASNSKSDDAIAAESLAVSPPVGEPTENSAAEAREPEPDRAPDVAADEPKETRRAPAASRRRTTASPVKRRPAERVEPKETASTPPPAPKADADEKGPPVSTSDFSRMYIRVGGMVDRLAREKGASVAGPFSDRYIRVSLTDSLRLDALRKKNMAELNRLEAQIEAKLK